MRRSRSDLISVFGFEVELLTGRPDAVPVSDRREDVVVQQTILGYGDPRRLEDLVSLSLFYYRSGIFCDPAELLEVLDREPARAPHKIVDSVVEAVTVQIDGRDAYFLRASPEICFGYEKRDRSFVEGAVSSEPDMDYSRLVYEQTHDSTGLVVPNQA